MLLSSFLAAAGCAQQADVLAGRNDDAGTGANLQETVLTPQLLKSGRFGKLWSYDVDGLIYAQPLIVSGVTTQYGTRNLLLVATTKNKLYAFDAEHGTPNIIWQRDFTGSGTLSESESLHYLAPSVGILSTPVVDKAANSIYLVSRSYENGAHVNRLHRVSIDTGMDQNSITIDALETNGTRFDPENQINRPGLVLVNGLVITLWGSFLDGGLPRDNDIHGWAMAFDKSTLALKGSFCTTCGSGVTIGGMIWQSGRPPAVQAGRYVYFFTGNGWLNKDQKDYLHSCDPSMTLAKPDGYFAESLIRLDTQNAPSWKDNGGVASWTPYDWCELDKDDADLGGSGPVLITGTASQTPVVVGGGKAGVLYAIDASKITSPNLVEWRTATPAPSAASRFGAINECVDFEKGASLPPPLATIDVPSEYAFPWSVPTGAVMGGEHDHIEFTFRPLCSPVSTAAGNISWGVKQDGQMHHIMGGAVFLPSGHDPETGTLFLAPENLPIVAFDVHEGRLESGPRVSELSTLGVEEGRTVAGRPFSRVVTTFTASHHPGGFLALSAAGNAMDTAIVWVSHFRDAYATHGRDATEQVQAGVLQAFDAVDLRMLWSSDAKLEDAVGYFQKFTPPTIANGKVYLAASSAPRSPSPIQLCEQAPNGSDTCLYYDRATTAGHIGVYGELPRRWPWEAQASARKKP